MNKEQIKQYYERIEKLLNGVNKETYDFTPEEIRQILKWYEHLQDRINKAIEILESLDFYKFTYPLDALDYDKNHLLETLKGGEINENRTNNKIME